MVAEVSRHPPPRPAIDYGKEKITNAGVGVLGEVAAERGWATEEEVQSIVSTVQTVNNMAGSVRRGNMDPEKCFVAGTLVSTPKGLVAIERIKVGDQVYAFDVDRGEKQVGKVVRTFERKTDTLVEVRIGDVTIQTTDEHPFYIVGVGWVEAKELVAGDTVLLESGGRDRITSVTLRRETATVYNFEVAGLHNYFVSTLAVLVHNNCSTDTGGKAKGANNPKVAGAAKTGQEAHRQLEADLRGQGYQTEVPITLPGGRRVRKDGAKGNEVVIIKPDTVSGRSAAQTRSDLMASHGYDPRTVTYNPQDPRFQSGSPTYIGPKKKS